MPEIRLKESQTWLQKLKEPTQFSLGPVIGQGDSAVVHEATDSAGQIFAIKVIEEITEGSIQNAYEEYQILDRVCKENSQFPKFFGAFRRSQVPNQIWFVMELCEEGSVKDLLHRMKMRERLLKEDIIAYILRETAMGLKTLHEVGIIHRDVKAANILISKDGNVKLCDFGFARKVKEGEKIQEVVGSPYWMAPEVVIADRNKDSTYDTRADVWSLGILGIELGDWEAANIHVYAPRVLFQIVQNPPPALNRPSDWTQRYNDFITECLEKNPDFRPWMTELIEHPFISEEVAGKEKQIRGNLLHLLHELKEDPIKNLEPEIVVRSRLLKMGRTLTPRQMYHDDLATLDEVTETTVIETLSQRFAEGNIYTFVGDILLVTNLFKEMPECYGEEVAKKYKYRARCDNAPHIYSVADRAYQDMMHHKEVQNIVLTGETGSGKTTAGKHLLWHLVNTTESSKDIVQKIMNVPIILQAFGNASSIFNPNSTRHIQYFKLTFTNSGRLSGGILWTYCLEKLRITNCGRNQSNFHIFYYLLDTLSTANETKKYFLEKGKTYNYLPLSPAHNNSDEVFQRFQEVKAAFTLLDFGPEEQETIVKILSAILLLGELRLIEKDQVVELGNADLVEKIAELLEVDGKKLKWTFTNYCVVTGGEAIRGKNTLTEAEETRASLARSLYCRLFDWIVNLINTKLSYMRLVLGEQHVLGILDIPGFECYADNDISQFLINMTNEQMQFVYNQRVFIWEMHDCEKEELSQPGYCFHDNRGLLDAVLSKPNGLLALLDDETTNQREDASENFVDKLEIHLKNQLIRKSDLNYFTIFHYSGQVRYSAKNFIANNRNFLSPETVQVLRESKNAVIIQLFVNLMTKTGNLTIKEDDIKKTRWTSALSYQSHHSKRFNTTSRGKYSQSRQMQTAASTMRNSLLEMLQRVSQGSAHFIRCLRSNLKCSPLTFDRDLIRYQVRALGIIDSIRARQLGYSRRLKFHEFLHRYKFLAFDFDEQVEETKDNCRLLLIRLKMEGWALGTSKVFLKYYNEEFLSRLYETKVHKVIKIQSMMRAFLVRKKNYKRFPRLAELRQGSTSSDSKELALVKKSVTEARQMGQHASKHHCVGYTTVGNFKPPEERKRVSLNLPSTSKENPDRPRSPQEIAKAFEKSMGEDRIHCGARHGAVTQVIPRAHLPPSKLPKPTPEIVNKLNQPEDATIEERNEPGPYNFRALLKRSVSKDPSGAPNFPAPTPLLELNMASKGKRPTKNFAPAAASPIPTRIPKVQPRLSRRSKSPLEDPKFLSQIPSGGKVIIEKIVLAPDLVIEGAVADL